MKSELAVAYAFWTYVPDPKQVKRRVWAGKPAEYRRCEENNRRRVRRRKSKRLQRLRSERCERTFAHICDGGGTRRSPLRGLEDVSKRYAIADAAYKLGRILRSLTGVGKPRALRTERGLGARRPHDEARSRTIARYFNGLLGIKIGWRESHSSLLAA